MVELVALGQTSRVALGALLGPEEAHQTLVASAVFGLEDGVDVEVLFVHHDYILLQTGADVHHNVELFCFNSKPNIY